MIDHAGLSHFLFLFCAPYGRGFPSKRDCSEYSRGYIYIGSVPLLLFVAQMKGYTLLVHKVTHADRI